MRRRLADFLSTPLNKFLAGLAVAAGSTTLFAFGFFRRLDSSLVVLIDHQMVIQVFVYLSICMGFSATLMRFWVNQHLLAREFRKDGEDQLLNSYRSNVRKIRRNFRRVRRQLDRMNARYRVLLRKVDRLPRTERHHIVSFNRKLRLVRWRIFVERIRLVRSQAMIIWRMDFPYLKLRLIPSVLLTTITPAIFVVSSGFLDLKWAALAYLNWIVVTLLLILFSETAAMIVASAYRPCFLRMVRNLSRIASAPSRISRTDIGFGAVLVSYSLALFLFGDARFLTLLSQGPVCMIASSKKFTGRLISENSRGILIASGQQDALDFIFFARNEIVAIASECDVIAALEKAEQS